MSCQKRVSGTKPAWYVNERLTKPSSCTDVREMSASMSMALDMDAGMAS